MTYWRRRKKRKRAKARFKQEGMTARELAAKVGISARTVRFYMSERVLPAPEFRGAATRYGRDHLVCVAAIRWLQREKGMSLPAIRQYLKTADRAEVERVAAAFLPELAAGAVSAPQAAPSSSVGPVVAAVSADTWQRWSPLPGLEVHLHSSASPEVRALARRMAEQFSAGAQRESTQPGR